MHTAVPGFSLGDTPCPLSAPAWERRREQGNQCINFDCAAAVSEACGMKDLERNQEKWWYVGLLQKRGVNDMPARKSKRDPGSEAMLCSYIIFVGHGRGKWSLYVNNISMWSYCNAWNYTKICDEHGRVNSNRCFCGSSSLPFLKIREQKCREEKAGGVTEIWIL